MIDARTKRWVHARAIGLLIAAVGCSTAEDLDVLDSGDAGLRDGGSTADAGLFADAGPARDGGSEAARDGGAQDGGAAPDDCLTDVTPGRHEFACDGLTFAVSIPPACAAPGCGLIFDVHGLSMSGAMQENNTDLAALTQTLDYVVVQPSATPRPPLASWTQRTDDPKLLDFLERTMRVLRIDEGRVHFTGFSQGGWMTWRFLCEHADLFASVAPAAGSDYCTSPGVTGCNFDDALPSEEVSILYMHGTQDALVDFACGQSQMDAVIAAWNLTLDGVVSEDAKHRYERYLNANGTVLEWVRHDYVSDASSNLPLVPDIVGHCYPGSTDPGDEPGQLYSFRCTEPTAFDWGEIVLDFFQRTAR